MEAETEDCQKIIQKLCKDRISSLPEILLVEILLLLPIEDAMATAILSKRWRSVWKMLPRFEYNEPYDEGDKKVWSFIDKSLLQLSKAPVIEKLSIYLGPSSPDNVDVGKWVDNVVNRSIQWLIFSLETTQGPRSLSKRLYTCKTLKKLTLVHKILVDVPSEASLPSLVELGLECVVYKDEDSLVRLLTSCPVLQTLFVERNEYVTENDNVTNFNVKVHSLKHFSYWNGNNERDIGGSLVIDSPGLKMFKLYDYSGDACLIENMPPCLDMAKVNIESHLDKHFMTSLSSVMYLNLTLMDGMDAICFSRLIECRLTPHYSSYNWLQSIMHLLRSAPKLRVLMINTYDIDQESEDVPLWNSVPECLSSHLEIFEWQDYGGRENEKILLTYILAKSMCLKTVRVSLNCDTYKAGKENKMMDELESMYKVSESSKLFFTADFRWRSMRQHPASQVMFF